ncbi:Ragulator complex protein LAMTOR5 [Amphibalanus amphitrite]|uniref:Ragulator complex protein LAMTOR5 n=1 Tax=Amphibalanus amphitrite TaxID=1232801 RepID=A0A6A4W0W7_AMPAM|nr:Ragulator complex protein LAMTOR5 [Amphibalanus amphitrite]
MDAAVVAAVEESQVAGAAGLLAVDSAGLCLTATGRLQETAGGRLALVAAAARRVHPDAPRPPVLVLETESSVCMVTGLGAVTTALLHDRQP